MIFLDLKQNFYQVKLCIILAILSARASAKEETTRALMKYGKIITQKHEFVNQKAWDIIQAFNSL